MKRKKVLLSVLVCAVVVGSSVYAGSQSLEVNDSNLLLENVEALAGGENASGNIVTCYSSSNAKKGSTYYDCGDCKRYFNSKGTGDKRDCRAN